MPRPRKSYESRLFRDRNKPLCNHLNLDSQRCTHNAPFVCKARHVSLRMGDSSPFHPPFTYFVKNSTPSIDFSTFCEKVEPSTTSLTISLRFYAPPRINIHSYRVNNYPIFYKISATACFKTSETQQLQGFESFKALTIPKNIIIGTVNI